MSIIRHLWVVSSVITFGSVHGEILVDFENLPDPPAVDSFKLLVDANEGSSDYADIVWSADFVVVGGDYVESFHNQGDASFATPKSGEYAVFNAHGRNRATLLTTRRLVGLWVSRPDLGGGPRGATEVTVHALRGSLSIGSETIELTETGLTPVFLDTSSFLNLHSVDGYRVDRTASGVDPYGGGHYVLDDLAFAAEPVPGELDFDSEFLAPIEGLTGIAANGSVGLTWQEVEGAAFYDLYWSEQPGIELDGETNRISFIAPGFVHRGLSNGQAYTYVVIARDQLGNASRSLEVSVTPGQIAGSSAPDTITTTRTRWEYLHPTNGIDPSTQDPDFLVTWHTPSVYDGAPFRLGRGLYGYGRINAGTIQTNIGTPRAGDRYSAYFRSSRLRTSQQYTFLAFEILADDGGVFYIDGQRVATVNFSGEDTYAALTDRVGSENDRRIVLIEHPLKAGEHTFAFSLHNAAADSSDLGFELDVFGGPDHLKYFRWGLVEGELGVEIDFAHRQIMETLPVPAMIAGRPVVRIGTGAFEDCRFSQIILPATLEMIGTRSFHRCSRLIEVTIPDGVLSIPSHCFRDCKQLERVTLSPGTIEIGSSSFFGCSKLRQIRIPESVSSIGPAAFAECLNLESVAFLGDAPGNVEPSSFHRVARGTRAYVRTSHADSFGGYGVNWHGLVVSPFPIEIFDLRVIDGQISIRFTGEPGVSDWQVKGTADLSEFSDNLTASSELRETSTPGIYEAVIQIEDLSNRYFVRIER